MNWGYLLGGVNHALNLTEILNIFDSRDIKFEMKLKIFRTDQVCLLITAWFSVFKGNVQALV